MAAPGTTQNLKEGRSQVIQAFLNSLSSGESSQGANGGSFTPDQVERLSNKLGQILGDIEDNSGRRNEKGELVNEEGLPIVDINEPTNSSTEGPGESVPYEEPDLLPLWALGPAERDRRRRERDRLLDMLEEEERAEQERDAEREEEQRRQELEKRKEAAKADLEKLKAARELQKKMGKALLRNMADAKEREEQEKRRQAEEDRRATEERKRTTTLRPRKSVTFADKPDHNADESKRLTPAEPAPDLGDVSLAKLMPPRRGLPTQKELDSSTMKMNVVERFPAALRSPPPLGKNDAADEGDSDDESVPGSPVPADSDEGDIIESEPDSDGSDEDVVLDEEYDIDTVQHHREIALAYYEKRSTIGAEAKKAMTSHTHVGEHEWDQPEVPQEATLASPPPKPPISRFKANRKAAHNVSSLSSSDPMLASTSLGALVIPASQTRELERAIRTGKIENGDLIGGEEGESGSDVEADEKMREVLEMLKRAQVTNAGPSGAGGPSSTVDYSRESSMLGESVNAIPVSKVRPQTSRFRSAFAAAQAQSPAESSPGTPATPVNNTGRSSPKAPAVSSTIVERNMPSSGRLSSSLGRKPASLDGAGPLTSPVVSSSAIPLRSGPTSVSPSPSANNAASCVQPTVIDSPSFQPGPKQSAATPSATMSSMTVESPSFPSPSSTSRPERPPVVMSAQVRESASSSRQSDSATMGSEGPKKVSRFLAQRTGH
ncbi:hypothetical protein GLOTRDRAFT_136801 [Gloeophyllum trabeum ATCC 11539]|uniref:DUF3835 domain-containing protein n=1 Tax=Gloeophyllum trabeum (strain ATCC 11539 / FP-39264 / Madison 617) TaxID=670483 RepID=S7RTK4_GLOTA|nr:uncharacterized protein GLOTRDRAFT_136801 [Gloeophyllum trabeum ATCC 11539]EPQ57995.1 hypothetical protein GLOTRDRAFT_136801 [Gloeophyllum trabeum ATCC 11539]